MVATYVEEGGQRGVGPSRLERKRKRASKIGGPATQHHGSRQPQEQTSRLGARGKDSDRTVEDMFRRGWGGGGCDEGYLCPPHAEERRSLQDDAEATRHRHKKGKKRVEEEEENGVDGTLKRHQRHRIDSPASRRGGVVPAHGPEYGPSTQRHPRDFSVVLQSMLPK